MKKASKAQAAARIGAVCYFIWGILHLQAAYNVIALADEFDPGMVQGRLYQDAWNLAYFAIFAMVIAVVFNWRNNRWGYWLALAQVSATDIGFIVLILIPGYLPLFPGILGPVFWVLGAAFTTAGYLGRD